LGSHISVEFSVYRNKIEIILLVAQVRPIYFGNYVPIILAQLELKQLAQFAPKWVAHNGAIYPVDSFFKNLGSNKGFLEDVNDKIHINSAIENIVPAYSKSLKNLQKFLKQ
jgi:hypothetical protein